MSFCWKFRENFWLIVVLKRNLKKRKKNLILPFVFIPCFYVWQIFLRGNFLALNFLGWIIELLFICCPWYKSILGKHYQICFRKSATDIILSLPCAYSDPKSLFHYVFYSWTFSLLRFKIIKWVIMKSLSLMAPINVTMCQIHLKKKIYFQRNNYILLVKKSQTIPWVD